MRAITKNALTLTGFLLSLSFSGAGYGLTLNEAQKLLASDGMGGDEFGYTVALDGDTAVIGAPYNDYWGGDSGSAYVFTRTAGVWSQQAKLRPDRIFAGDHFGWSVAIDGDTVLVGAVSTDDSGPYSGTAYVFTRSGTTWSQQAQLTPAEGAGGDSIGWSVALDGDTALIGAQLHDGATADEGAAYVFTRSGTTWTEQAELTAFDATHGDAFGYSVALDGDTALIGVPYDYNPGSAYVFSRSGTTWTHQAKLTASDGAYLDYFGWSVALAGDTALIGARLDDDNGLPDSGSLYVFTRSVSVWSQQTKLTPSDAAAGDQFGFSAAFEGDEAVIGAPYDDDNAVDSGSAYLFTRTGGVWSETAKLLASMGDASDRLGYHHEAVAVSGATALAGAYLDDDKGTNSGSAYVFTLPTAMDDEGPVTSNVSVTPNPAPVNTLLLLTASVDDTTTGGSTIASAAYTIDGGGGGAMNAQEGGFDAVMEDVTATLSFPEAGVYNVCVSGTDSVGNTGDEECVLLAVYDPDGGFVTGGGWIQSPPGAYTADPSLSGRANFGFVSKYKKGANTPSGNTDFRFKAGDLDFHSDTYDWLIITGARAQYKGVGTINGAGNYGFMLTAIDAALTPSTDTDLFRIKIWDMDAGDAIVYDNQIGAGDNADPTTAIAGGSIVIHTQGKK